MKIVERRIKLYMLVVLVVSGLAMMAGPFDDVAAQESFVPQDSLKATKGKSKGQMVSTAKADIEKMKGTLQKIDALLKKTREEDKDLDKLNCINGKLSAIKGFLKVSEQSQEKMNDSLDKESMRHQYALISIASSKVENLELEAQSCAGEVLRYAGNTEVVSEIDSNIAEIDPTQIVNETETLFRLPEVTPYQ